MCRDVRKINAKCILIDIKIYGTGDSQDIIDLETMNDGVCGIVAATDIESRLSNWCCNQTNQPCTDPCQWDYASCDSNGAISNIYLTNQQLTGSLASSIGGLSALTGVYFDRNSLDGVIPESFGNLSSMHVLTMTGNALTGEIPSSLCNLPSASNVNLLDNPLDCVEPGTCVAAMNNLAGGSLCTNDGSITRFFATVTLSCACVLLLATISKHFYHPPAAPTHTTDPEAAASVDSVEVGETENSKERASEAGALDKLAAHAQNHVIKISLVKLALVCVVSLVLDDYWRYCGTGAGDDDTGGGVLQFCSATCSGSDGCGDTCASQCETSVQTSFTSTCSATFTQRCACRYWSVFVLVPLLLHVLQFALQCACHYRYANFDPQKEQYVLLLRHRGGARADMGADADMDTLSLVRALCDPPLYSVFSFIEAATLLYVWVELFNLPVRCDTAVPTSQLYYPILMTLLDMGKLNVFAAVEAADRGQYLQAALCALDLRTFAVYVYYTFLMSGGFVVGLFGGLQHDRRTTVAGDATEVQRNPLSRDLQLSVVSQ